MTRALAFTPSGRGLIVGTGPRNSAHSKGGPLFIWDTNTGTALPPLTLPGPESPPTKCLVLSPDGKLPWQS